MNIVETSLPNVRIKNIIYLYHDYIQDYIFDFKNILCSY